ncbi:MAG: pilus assembly protein PilM [Planctomycetota bacterium]|jgi:type IV pilus assembly protein PilM
MSESQVAWGIDPGTTAIKAVGLRRIADGQFQLIGTHVAAVSRRYSPVAGKPGRQSVNEPDSTSNELLAGLITKLTSDSHYSPRTPIVMGLPDSRCFQRLVNVPVRSSSATRDSVRDAAFKVVPIPPDNSNLSYIRTGHDESGGTTQFAVTITAKDELQAQFDLLQSAGVSSGLVVPVSQAAGALLAHLESDSYETRTLLDIGATTSTLVVDDQHRFWSRSLPVGGNSFTEVIADEFDLDRNHAEKRKKTAAKNRDPRELFSVMRPVFERLAGEIHRSFGAMTTDGLCVPTERIVVTGGGSRLSGLTRYLEQQLQREMAVPGVLKFIEAAHNLRNNSDRLATAIGLALTGLGAGTHVTPFQQPRHRRIPLLDAFVSWRHRRRSQ